MSTSVEEKIRTETAKMCEEYCEKLRNLTETLIDSKIPIKSVKSWKSTLAGMLRDLDVYAECV
jgi:hypothetical protein